MHRPLLSLLALLAFFFFGSVSTATAGSPDTAPTALLDDGLSSLRALRIENGTMTLLRRDASPTLTFPDGRVREGVPPRTIVKLTLRPASGSNIQVEIWLPDPENWNARFLGLGNSGSAGHINSSQLLAPLIAGYAVATTDLGTAPNTDSGVGNREVWKDFGFRATHLMTLAAKRAIAAYYGKDPDFSYFSGASTGGQQGLQEAQRYPDDYDGIVAAIPAHCRTPLHAYFLWNHQILRKRPFTAEQEANVIAAGNEYMASRGVPAAAGKFVSDPRRDAQDIEGVIALALRKDPTLSAEHAEALRKLFDGPRHALTGERIFNGIPFGASFGGARGHLYLFKWALGGDKKMEDIDFAADIDAYTAALGPFLNAENADLGVFKERGGKIIMTSGSVDSIVPLHATLDYYERVIERFGDVETARSFFRFYVVPGMGHGGGPGIHQTPDLLELVRSWREEGVAPERLIGRRVVRGETELEMPLYPYPTKTAWDATRADYVPVAGPRGGVERVAARFRPAAEE